MTRVKIRCFKCNGKGEIREVDPFLGVITLGLTALIDIGFPDECDACNGKGWIYSE